MRTFYNIFLIITILGYGQMIYCIVLAVVVPINIYIMYRLIMFRLNREAPTGDDFMGGLMKIPLPIPEILSQLNRTKYGNSTSIPVNEKQCAICWAEFQLDEEVTPLLCDQRHLFHTTCIEAWIRNGHNSCPLCRKQIANI